MDISNKEQLLKLDQLTQITDETSAAIIIVDYVKGTFQYVNRRVCEDTGKSYAQIIGSHYKDVFWPEFISIYHQLVEKCRDGNRHTTIYYWAEMAIWEQISAHIMGWTDTPCVMLTITNITEVARSEYKFENIAYFDNLLGLPNGVKLEKDISELANVETVALLYISIQRLKEVNHIYGWRNGDYLLTQVRDWLVASETRRAQLYRINNGFVILGRLVTIEAAKERAEEIIDRFEAPWILSAGGNTVSVYCDIKVGIIYGKYAQNEMRNLLMRTIQLPSEGCRYVIYDEQADRRTKKTMTLRHKLVNCVHHNMSGFQIRYQPIINTKTGRWVALEALCRWTPPNEEPVPPSVFIPLAEQLGVIGKIDTWVRRNAMEQCVALGLDEKDFFLSLNFSPAETVSEAFVAGIESSLEQTGFPVQKLSLEITENAKMGFDADSIYQIRRLSDMGVKFSLDDFGTGYSSLENLIKVPAGSLKMDRLLIDRIEDDKDKQYLLELVVNLANHLDMLTIAEGVETMEQLTLLERYGVSFIQGYLFSQPLSLEELKKQVDNFAG